MFRTTVGFVFGAPVSDDFRQTCDSATIIITSANLELANIHDRMPVILHKEDFPLWLDPSFEGQEKLLSLMQPYLTEELIATAI